MNKLLKISILLLLFVPWQKVAGQGNIIMGTTSFVGDIDDQPRYFYDPGGTGYFGQGLQDTITLRTGIGGTQLYVLFEEFAMGDGDTLWVFDGASVSAPLMGCYSLMNSPGEILASGRCMTFVFHSSSEPVFGLQDGWKALVYVYDPVSQQINYGEFTMVLTCNALFYDAGGPNGNINANGTPPNSYTQFTSPLGTHIKCHFTQFQASGVLKIYDGMHGDPNHRLIGQFCNNTLNNGQDTIPTFFSSTNTLCFEYVSGSGDNNKSGWCAEISCVPELVETPSGTPCLDITNVPMGDYADAPNPHVIEHDTLHPKVVLRADIPVIGLYSNDYKVEQIPYDENEMLFRYNEGTAISMNDDDKWLNGVNLPFTFMFFGNPYTTVYPGTNGLISMDNPPDCVNQGLEVAYMYGNPPQSPPYTNISGNQCGGTCGSYGGANSCQIPYNYRNCIYGVYEDVDSRYFTNKNDGYGQGAVRVGVLGEYPCRAFVFNYLNVALYGLAGSTSFGQYENYNTYQMVLYEGTNIIDVYVKHRKCCATSNQRGEGIIGLQNSTSSQILLAPGRGMTGWSADNEHWRFTPVTPPTESGELTWYKDTVDDDHIISYSPTAQNRTIAARPTETTSYISEYKYVDVVGNQIVLRDTTLVLVPEPEPIDSTGIAVRSAGFEVYPNPTHDAVYVKLQNTCEMPSAFEVLDLNGRLLFAVPAQETTRVDLSRLPAGVYLLRAVGGKGTAVKITKQ